MEILAPAGSPESLVAAVKGGADAVYLAGKDFGARASAKNFSDPELEGAVAYAHANGVRVHVTVNTLVKNSELDEAVQFVQFVKDAGADAVIIQDLGLLDSIRHIPIAKHASTQMQIHSLEGARWCAENGISRAILARELTLEEISAIASESPVELEVFVQGAMCYCMSGGCLFSSMAGGRSGNRGECAQPCRKRYESPSGSGYLLSNADLYAIGRLKDLERMGIASVKIEGRMRSPAYAYLATRAYSLAYRNPDDPELAHTVELLKTVFNRGYCNGYLDGVRDLVQSTYPDNRGQYLGRVHMRNRRFSTEGLGLGIGDGVSFFFGEEKVGGFKVRTLGTETVPVKMADGEYDLYRTYDPRIDEVKNLIGQPPKLTGGIRRCPWHRDFSGIRRERSEPELSFYVSTLKVLEAVLPYADRVYYDGPDWEEAMGIAGDSLVVHLPRMTPEEPEIPAGVPVMVHNPGQYRRYDDGRQVYCSHVCNMMNSAFPLEPYQTTLSLELSRAEIRDICSTYGGRLECMAFGRAELMYSRDPNLAAGSITDGRGFVFPVYRDRGGFVRILNSSDTMLLDRADELSRWGIDSLGIDVRKRPAALAQAVGKAFRTRSAEDAATVRRMCGGTVNTGHYLRGV